MLSKEDLEQIRMRGSDPQIIEKQLERFIAGFPYAQLIKPASVNRGITSYGVKEKEEMASYFDERKAALSICRFVPASGAATRMFKALFSLRDTLADKSANQQKELLAGDETAQQFFDELEEYPFFKDLDVQEGATPYEILEDLLTEKRLNYGMLPKGMLKFHVQGEISRTAFEEHLHEAARIILPAKDVMVHFTVSEEHLDGFRKTEKELVPQLQDRYGVTYRISYSFQKKETDTIAVDPGNTPFRDENGNLVFRPGGHGALLENLNVLDNDLLFINNIDNVSPDRNSKNRVLHKKVLAGTLLQVRDQLFRLIDQLEQYPSRDEIQRAEKWLTEVANFEIPEDYFTLSEGEKLDWLLSGLDRPIRVCGMVKNEGEPGGGPYFVKDTRGITSLQIVESSQVDHGDLEQEEIFQKASHFNPVDIVCSVRNRKGDRYDLTVYVDQETGFVSHKSVKGKDLKALELPGLWNGSMSGWITIFVEIPGSTFTPVKTIFDLLRKEHRD